MPVGYGQIVVNGRGAPAREVVVVVVVVVAAAVVVATRVEPAAVPDSIDPVLLHKPQRLESHRKAAVEFVCSHSSHPNYLNAR